MHRKSQSTSALSVIVSARDQPATASHLPSGHFLPSLSANEADEPSPMSRHPETRSRISHSRTKSDLPSLAPESRSAASTPTRSRILRREVPETPCSALRDGLQRSIPQPARRREAASSTEEETSEASDLDLGRSRPSKEAGNEAVRRTNQTPLRRSREDIRGDPPRKTPRTDPSTPKRLPRGNGLQDLTLDQCPAIVRNLSWTATFRNTANL